ncbi:MAG TPA: MbnP family copper-binding protein [Thermoanaerobaculia bacterium]|nr:MbnP family copper-binding protein [Thermoanaerobaculia bacterium]
MRLKSSFLGLGGVVTAAILAGAHTLAAATVELRFSARVGKEPARCGATYTGIGLSRASMFLQDFRVYVSSIRLLKADGSEVPVALTPDGVWQNDQVALLDFEDATGNCNGNAPTNDRVKGTVPEGQYTGVVFEIGVPFALNHQDPTLAGPPLNFSALTWPWAGGYKFTTIDFDTKAPGERRMVPVEGSKEKASASGFSVHLGSTGCVSSGPRVPPQAPCANPNRPVYRFESFDAGKDVIIMDLAALLAGTDVTVNMPESPSGCMSFPMDDDCIAIMDRFGLPFRGKPSAGQTFVRVEHGS